MEIDNKLPRAVADPHTLRKHLHEIHSLAEHDSAAALRRFNEIFYPEEVTVPVVVPDEDKLSIYIADAFYNATPCRHDTPCVECHMLYKDKICLLTTNQIATELLRRGVKLPTEE